MEAKMSLPELKQECDFTSRDFERFPVWIGVHNYDIDEPWYDECDEETYRPWTGQLPFTEKRGIALVAATIEFADGSIYPGYYQSTRENWDTPPSPSKTLEGAPITNPSWSARLGGTQLSVLALLNPTVFVD